MDKQIKTPLLIILWTAAGTIGIFAILFIIGMIWGFFGG